MTLWRITRSRVRFPLWELRPWRRCGASYVPDVGRMLAVSMSGASALVPRGLVTVHYEEPADAGPTWWMGTPR